MKIIDKEIDYRKRIGNFIDGKIESFLKENNIVLEGYSYYFRCAVIRDSREKAWGNFMSIDSEFYRYDAVLDNIKAKELFELLIDNQLNLKIYIFKNTSNVILITDNDVEVDEEHCIVSFFNERHASTQYFNYYDYFYYPYDCYDDNIEMKTLQEREMEEVDNNESY